MSRIDRNFATVRWVEWQQNVVQALDAFRNLVVELDNHLVGEFEPCWRVTNCGTEHDVAFVGYALHFNQSHVHLAIVTIAEFLCKFAQVAVVVVHFASVDAVAHFRERLIRSAVVKSVSAREFTVGVVSNVASAVLRSFTPSA